LEEDRDLDELLPPDLPRILAPANPDENTLADLLFLSMELTRHWNLGVRGSVRSELIQVDITLTTRHLSLTQSDESYSKENKADFGIHYSGLLKLGLAIYILFPTNRIFPAAVEQRKDHPTHKLRRTQSNRSFYCCSRGTSLIIAPSISLNHEHG
jgi:hypothetical protein